MRGNGPARSKVEAASDADGLARGLPCGGELLKRLGNAVMASAPASTPATLFHADQVARFVAAPKNNVLKTRQPHRCFIVHDPAADGHWLIAVLEPAHAKKKPVLTCVDNAPRNKSSIRKPAKALAAAMSTAAAPAPSGADANAPCWRAVLHELARRAGVVTTVFDSTEATLNWVRAGATRLPPPEEKKKKKHTEPPTAAAGPTARGAAAAEEDKPGAAEQPKAPRKTHVDVDAAMQRDATRRQAEAARSEHKKDSVKSGVDLDVYYKAIDDRYLIVKDGANIVEFYSALHNECVGCRHRFENADPDANCKAQRQHITRLCKKVDCPLSRARLDTKKVHLYREEAAFADSIRKALRVPRDKIAFIPLSREQRAAKQAFLRRPLGTPETGGETEGPPREVKPVHIRELTGAHAALLADLVSTRDEHLPPGTRKEISTDQKQRHYRTLTQDLRDLDATMNKHHPEWRDMALTDAMLAYAKWKDAQREWTPTTFATHLGTIMGALTRLALYTRQVMFDASVKFDSTWKAAEREARKNTYAYHHAQAFQAQLKDVEQVASNPKIPERIRVIVILTWLVAGRVGDVIQLQKKDVERKTGRGLWVTYRRGKTILMTGPRTVNTAFAEKHDAWMKMVDAHLATVDGDMKFLFHAPSENERKALRSEVCKALRTADPRLTCPSLRIGALQSMWATETPLRRLVEFSGHTTEAMLLRYLRYSKAQAQPTAEAREDAERLAATADGPAQH